MADPVLLREMQPAAKVGSILWMDLGSTVTRSMQ